MSIQTTTLKNGLRVITDTVTAVDSVALGVWAGVGTRHEDMSVNGVAHMVEHMLFKGTKTRNAGEIAEKIENVGGSMNAYTSRDMTAYHVHVLKDHTQLALEILSDIIQNSTLPEDEIERERTVILQEIGMSMDTPDDYIFDNYQETAYPDQSLGAPILGKATIIAGVQREAMANYIRRFYTPSRLVVSAAGNVDHDNFVRMVEGLFINLPPDNAFEPAPARYIGGDHRLNKSLEQSHIVLGFSSIDRHDTRYHTAIALSIIMGGGMSSRLFQEVREKRGLVYSVFSFHSAYDDDGQFAMYAGTGPERLPELIPVLCDEVQKIRHAPVKPEELARAKTQMKSNLLMSRESMMTRAGQQAKHLIHFNHALDIDRLVRDIEVISIESIQALAQEIFSRKPTLAGLGPMESLEPYDTIVKRLVA